IGQHTTVRATPVAQRLAAAAGIDIGQVAAGETDGTIRKEDVERFLAQRTPAAPRPRATPAARRVAREHGIDLARVTGSGPHGRIQASDVRATADTHAEVATSLSSAEEPLQSSSAVTSEAELGEPTTGIRR